MPGSELKEEQGHNPATSRYYWHSQHCMPGWQGQVAAAPRDFRSDRGSTAGLDCVLDRQTMLLAFGVRGPMTGSAKQSIRRFPHTVVVRLAAFAKASAGQGDRRPHRSLGGTGRSSTPRPLDYSPASLEYWVARSSRAMTSESLAPSHSSNTPLHSRGVNSPELCMNISPLENRGRRECRALNAPAASCVKKQTHERSHHGHTGNHPAFPAQWFTAYFALFPVTRLA
jgi:hypothetical protein